MKEDILNGIKVVEEFDIEEFDHDIEKAKDVINITMEQEEFEKFIKYVFTGNKEILK